LILNVAPDGPAARAGLQPTRRDGFGRIHPGDAIIAVDGKEVNSAKELYAILDGHQVGDEVTLTIWRNGEQSDVKVTLAAQ
jgi:S1-C subfamily serine protease